VRVKALCEYCGGPINGKAKVLEFANFQRFFCCIGCKNNYREKHAGRRYTHKYTIPLYASGKKRGLINSNIELEHKCSSPQCSLLEILLE
jgi:hypothetical protein